MGNARSGDLAPGDGARRPIGMATGRCGRGATVRGAFADAMRASVCRDGGQTRRCVVPVNAGTHTPGRRFRAHRSSHRILTSSPLWLWVCAWRPRSLLGTTAMNLVPLSPRHSGAPQGEPEIHHHDDGYRRTPAIPRRSLARVLPVGSSLHGRGRRECRALAAPMARLRKKMQAAGTTGQPRHPGIPCAMALRLTSRSPQGPAFLPLSSARRLKHRSPTWPQHREARTTRLDRAHQTVRPHGRPTLQFDAPTASRAQRP